MRRWLLAPIFGLWVASLVLLVSPSVARADIRDFTLINGSTRTITHLYVGASDSDDWGEDILGQDVLNPGQSVDIRFSRYDGEAGTCLYDIMVMARDGAEGYLYKVDLCSTFTVTFN